MFCPCNNNNNNNEQEVSVPLQRVLCTCYSCSLSFPIFSHHILQNIRRRLFVCLFVLFFFFFFYGLGQLDIVLVCSRTRCASIVLLLYLLDDLRLFWFTLSFTVCDTHNL